MISVEQWRAAIGCFHAKSVYKPIATGERGSTVILLLVYSLLMHMVFSVKAVCRSVYISCYVRMRPLCYFACVVCYIYACWAWCAICVCACVACAYPITIWKVGVVAYHIYLYMHMYIFWLLLKYNDFSATVSVPNHTVGMTTSLCLLAFVLMMYFYEAIVGIIHCIEYLCAHALLLLCGIACKLCDYMAWLLYCLMRQLCVYYLLLLNVVAFKVYVWLLFWNMLAKKLYHFCRLLNKYGIIAYVCKFVYVVATFEVFILELLRIVVVRCGNGAPLHLVKPVPSAIHESVSYIAIVVCYMVLGISLHHVCSLAHKVYRVRLLVRCCNIIMISYKLYVCLLLLRHGDVEMNPGPASARTLKAKRKQSYEKNKEKELSQSKEYYKQNAEAIKIARHKHYEIKCEAKKASVRKYYGDNTEARKTNFRKYYADNTEARKTSVRKYYADNAEARKTNFRKYYADNTEARKTSVRKYYVDNAEARKTNFRKYYADNTEARKTSVRKYYVDNAEARKTNFRKYYADNAEYKKALSRKYSKWQYTLNPKRKIAAVKVNYLKTKKERQAYFKNRYALSEPKQLAHDRYNKIVLTNILGDAKATREIVRCYKGEDLKMFKRRPTLLKKVVSSVASKKLVNCALAIRKKNAGTLISIVKSVTKNIPLKSKNDFGDGSHCASSEPYFYDAAYGVLKTYLPIPVTPSGQCVVSRLCEPTSPKGPLQWECTIKKCKRLSDFEIDSILSLREAFDEPMHKLRKVLHTCDSGCPYEHFSKSITSLVFEDDSSVSIEHSSVERKGHPLVCYVGNHCSDYACKSKLRILRAAATHYPTLRNFLNYIYSALKSHMIIYSIDTALHNGDYQSLLQLTDMGNFEAIFDNDVNFSLQSSANGSGFRRPNLETYLAITHANIIAQYEKEVDDNHEHPCICCEQLYQRKNVVRIKLSDDLDSIVWPRIKSYVLQQNPTAADEVLFICNYSKKLIKNDKKLPSRCVLNGLEVVPIPPELCRLDSLSSQFIQLAKCYQTVVRLGTYFGNVPSYNSLKACKGSMFFLPLPLENTLETLDKAKDSANRLCALPNPELYIIVNGKPTKGKVVWRSLVDINHVKQAVQKLKEINWLYRDIDEQTLDEAAQQVKEVVTNTTSTMLVKATKEDIAEFQSYTIRNMDNKMSTGSDLEQYKVQNVQEDPLDNRQKYLDVMCFPVLFPTGQFGEHHPREVKLDFSQYIKSRLWNKDSRFRKTPQYVFYLLWQKGLRDVNAGIYSVLNTKKSRPMSVGAFMSKMGHSDEHLEASLSSIFSSVRGSSQYWFQRKSEVQCMIREYGSPTLFLTFSCAEYESPDIIGYLRKINGVSDSYSAGRLCTEDPISVSRKFSANFHAFFQKVLIKGGVLGTIDHYYWKKEYQARGAPTLSCTGVDNRCASYWSR